MIRSQSATQSFIPLGAVSKAPRPEGAELESSNSPMDNYQDLVEDMGSWFTSLDERKYDVSESLEKLKEGGQLWECKDSEGESLLQNFRDLADEQPELAAWTINHVAHPAQTFAQVPGTGTCVATVLAYESLLEEPAEFVRLIDELSSEKASARLPNGEVLKKASDFESDKANGGSPVERLLQASMMNFARPDEEYSLNEDKFQQGQDTGLFPGQMERLGEGLSGRDLAALPATEQELGVYLADSGEGFPATLRWNDPSQGGKHTTHAIFVTGVDSEKVYFQNPWGYYSHREEGPESRSTSTTCGAESLPKAEFLDRLGAVLVPAS